MEARVAKISATRGLIVVSAGFAARAALTEKREETSLPYFGVKLMFANRKK